MTTDKKAEQTAKPIAQQDSPRKTWKARTPIEVVLDQIAKQERKVEELQGTLREEKAMLDRLLEVKKVLEAN